MGPIQAILAYLARQHEQGPQPVVDWQNVTPDFVGPEKRGLPPMSYRDPMQAGPSPPDVGPITAMMRGNR